MSNRFIRLPFTFDPERLAQDLAHCLRLAWPDHFNRREYAGQWNSLSLRSISGSATDIVPLPSDTGYRDTPLLHECPSFRDAVDRFECGKEAVRLLRLGAGSVIHEHRDPGASYTDGFFRVHIPITSNSETRFLIDGHDLQMQPGECWYANFSLPHSVNNAGTTDRVHLVLDGLRNGWSDELFRRAGYDFDEEARARQMDPATARQVIEALRARGSETDRRLADDLERKLTG
jgi:hypothetical protein